MARKLSLGPSQEVSSIVSLRGSDPPPIDQSDAFHLYFEGIGIRFGPLIGGCLMVLRE